MVANQDIRKALKQAGIPFWRIAMEINGGVHEVTFGRYMRVEMSEQRKEEIISAIRKIKEEGT